MLAEGKAQIFLVHNMSAKINKHVFHGIYSNFGYRPNFTHERRLASFPIHFFRASFGELQNGVVKEFETEEEVLKWYKKNKYGESQYNELKFPDDFCKNYFIISESEFYKYKDLFHGMIKGLKISSDIEISSEGTAFSASCEITKQDSKFGIDKGATAGPIVFNSPNGEPSYFTVNGAADDIGYLNGIQITNGTTAGSFNQDLIPKTPQSRLSFTALDTVGGNVGISATVKWYTKINYNQKIKFTINFDSTKIFDFSELQKRLPADNLEYETNIDLKKDKNKEELTSILNKKIFKDEWKFDENVFNSIFKNEPSSFNYNSTFINDPVILQEGGPSISNIKDLNIILNHIFNANNDGSLSKEVIDKQKNFEKKFDKFGSINYQIKNENSIILSSNQSCNFYISNLFYIKSKKIYLCFFEIDTKIPLTGNIIDKQKECSSSSSSSVEPSGPSFSLDDLEFILTSLIPEVPQFQNTSFLASVENYNSVGPTNPFNIEYILTTNDSINNNPLKYKTSDCSSEEKELKFQKTKSQIKFLNRTFEIELFKLKENEFIFDNKDCKDLTPPFKNLIKNVLKFNINKEPTFEILEWKDSDFDKNNIFPPKIN